MKPAQAAEGRAGGLELAVILAMGTLPLTWIHVTAVGGFDLSIPYAFALVLGCVLWLYPSSLALGLTHLPAALGPWLVAYGIYLMILQIGLAGGETKGMVLRQIFFVGCGCIFALGIVATGGAGRVLRRGGLLALFGFLAIVEILARQIGLSWITVIRHLASTGDLEFVFYDFLRALFQLVAKPGSEAGASEKNLVAVALLTALVLYRAGHTGAGADRLGKLVTVLAFVMLLIVNTRSVLLIAFIALPLAAWLGALKNGVRSSGKFVVKSMLLIGFTALVIVMLSMDTSAGSLIGDRFSFSDRSSGQRFEQYSWALERIEAHPLTGSGMAEFEGMPVHNLFLGAWMHAGLLAFLLVIFTYLALVAAWIGFVIRAVSSPRYWMLEARFEWVAVLPILPMFRVWIAGDAGHPSLIEWTAVCSFFGMIVANRLTVEGVTTAPDAARVRSHG
jgi:O-antigen ligase